MGEGPLIAGEYVFVPRIGLTAWLGGWLMVTEPGWPCKIAEASLDWGHGIPGQMASWMTDAVLAAATSISVAIGVHETLLEGIIILVVSMVSPTGDVRLMSHGTVCGSDCNMGTDGMCTVWSYVDCCSFAFPEISQGNIFWTWGTAIVVKVDLLRLVTEYLYVLCYLSFDLLDIC